MERYRPLTGIDLIPASLLIGTQAPLEDKNGRLNGRVWAPVFLQRRSVRKRG